MRISVEESRSHLPPIKMHLVHFGSQSGKQSALKGNVIEGKKDKEQNKEEGPTTVKAMAKEIKLAQERKKVTPQ